MKICNQCKIEKENSEFYKDSRTKKDGLYGHCKKCHNKACTKWIKKHPEPGRIRAIKWYQDNPGKAVAKTKEYRKNPEFRKRTNKWNATYKRNNKAKINAINAFRRAAKLQATPKWLTKSMKTDINFFYHIRESMINPEDWHVDHIEPLLGETFRGLHVPWNLQIIPAFDNMSKHNKLNVGS